MKQYIMPASPRGSFDVPPDTWKALVRWRGQWSHGRLTASEYALRHGVSLRRVLQLVRERRIDKEQGLGRKIWLKPEPYPYPLKATATLERGDKTILPPAYTDFIAVADDGKRFCFTSDAHLLRVCEKLGLL